MKGIVFNLLEAVVSDKYGDAAWEQLIDQAGVEGVYTSLGSYPDQELFRLVGVASEMLNVPPDEIVRSFGEACIPLMAARFTEFFTPHQTTRSFLLSLNDVIHPEVRKLFPGVDVPNFRYGNLERDGLTLHYESGRKLCSFALGLIQGASAHYKEELSISHPVCMKSGASECVFHLRFQPIIGSMRASEQ